MGSHAAGNLGRDQTAGGDQISAGNLARSGGRAAHSDDFPDAGGSIPFSGGGDSPKDRLNDRDSLGRDQIAGGSGGHTRMGQHFGEGLSTGHALLCSDEGASSRPPHAYTFIRVHSEEGATSGQAVPMRPQVTSPSGEPEVVGQALSEILCAESRSSFLHPQL